MRRMQVHKLARTLAIAGVLCLAGGAAMAQPYSDSFNETTLSTFWTVANPNPASTVGLGKKGLEVVASALNGGSDLYPYSNFNAPLVLQQVNPATNWVITTELKFAPTNYFQGAGIILATQPGGFTDGSQFNRVAERDYLDGQEVRSAGDYFDWTNTTTYLRLEKKGTKYTGWWSADGKTWILGGSGRNSTAFTYVGLFTIRQAWDNKNKISSHADFRYFKVKILE